MVEKITSIKDLYVDGSSYFYKGTLDPFNGIMKGNGVYGPYICHCMNGKPHREDGPAVIREDGVVVWWYLGKRYSDINEWGKNLGILESDEFTMLKLEHG